MSKISVPYLNFREEFRRQEALLMPAVRNVFEKGEFILGEEVERFEKSFANLCGVKHAISVANGTDAIWLALKAIGVGPGDEVITASNSFIATAASIALLGATPVFADVEDDQNIAPHEIEKKITKRTKAILPVHLTGRCARLNEIMEISKLHGIAVIEDAAQSVSAEVSGVRAGAKGVAGCFSLHPLKNLNAAGDAGVITTSDDELATKFRLMRHHGLKNRDEVTFWGYNSRLDTIQAAILNVRLQLLEKYLERKRQIALTYTQALSEFYQCPEDTEDRPHTYHLYVIQTDRREKLRQFLSERGIDSKVHYPIPIHLQEAARYLGYKKGSLPHTERQAERILSLPVNPYLTDDQVNWVIESLVQFVK